MVRPSLIAAILMLAAGSASAQISIADYGAVPNDGVDDWTAVQAALASIPAVGGSVYVPPGTYDLSDTIQLKSRTRLFGVGPASILKFHGVSGGAGTSGAAGLMASANNSADMTIHDLGIDTSEVTSNNRCIAFYLSTNTRIEKVSCRTSGHAFVHVRSSNYWVVNNHVEVTNTLGHGVIDQWWGSHGGHIVGNTLNGNGLGLYGILVTGTDTTASQSTPCYDITISGNIVRNMDHVGIYLQGHLGGLDNVVVQGNVVDTTQSFFGILLDDNARGSIISNNVVMSAARAGIRLRRVFVGVGPRSTSIANNTVRNANTSGIAGDPGAAISLGAGANADSNSIVGNRIIGATHTDGVSLCAGCDDNIVALNGIAAGSGVAVVDGGTNNHVLNNY